jgi:hypothetical protein
MEAVRRLSMDVHDGDGQICIIQAAGQSPICVCDVASESTFYSLLNEGV